MWLFVIAGVVVYFVGTFVGESLLGILDGQIGIGLDRDNNFALALIALPFGLGAA